MVDEEFQMYMFLIRRPKRARNVELGRSGGLWECKSQSKASTYR